MRQTPDEAFALIEAAALKGERCPQSGNFGPLDTARARELARAGRIKIEIYALNWRVVQIMEGPNKGKRTASRPGEKAPPWRVLYKDHVKLNTSVMRRVSGMQPSAPRPLTRDEIER